MAQSEPNPILVLRDLIFPTYLLYQWNIFIDNYKHYFFIYTRSHETNPKNLTLGAAYRLY